MKKLIILFAAIALAACGGKIVDPPEPEGFIGKEPVMMRDATVQSADVKIGDRALALTRVRYAQERIDEINGQCIKIRVVASKAVVSLDIPVARLNQTVPFDVSPVFYDGGVLRIDAYKFYNFFLSQRSDEGVYDNGIYVAMRSWEPNTSYSGWCRLSQGSGEFDFVVEWELKQGATVVSTGTIAAGLE